MKLIVQNLRSRLRELKNFFSNIHHVGIHPRRVESSTFGTRIVFAEERERERESERERERELG